MTNPQYRHDPNQSKRKMEIRLDSRGSPLRRTYLGNNELYQQGKEIVEGRSKPK